MGAGGGGWEHRLQLNHNDFVFNVHLFDVRPGSVCWELRGGRKTSQNCAVARKRTVKKQNIYLLVTNLFSVVDAMNLLGISCLRWSNQACTPHLTISSPCGRTAELFITTVNSI